MSIVKLLKKIARRINGEVSTEKLISMGLEVGENFNRQQGCFIDPTHCFLISIGNNVTFSIRVVLMAHDASTKYVTGYTRIGRIKIGDNVFIGANSTILPNVNIGNNVVIGANSLVTRDIPDNSVAVGNPARVIKTIQEFKNQNMSMIKDSTAVFEDEYRMGMGLDEQKKNIMLEKLKKNSIGFIR